MSNKQSTNKRLSDRGDVVNHINKNHLIYLKTPVYRIPFFAMDESTNMTGSVKDRFAKCVIESLLEKGQISSGDTIVESSSGNFGIALAAQAKKFNLIFYCVIDPNICPVNERLLYKYGAKVVKVRCQDDNGGYLLTRLKKVEDIRLKHDALWINQYASRYAVPSYSSLADELLSSLKNIDYLFIAVSTGGTITGISRRIRKLSPNTKIIAVDVEGSLVFSDIAKVRHIPGLGSSLKSMQIKEGDVDEAVIIPEIKGIEMCYKIRKQYRIILGGSSGVIVAAIEKYFTGEKVNGIIGTIFSDGGDRYLDTIYNKKWLSENYREVNNAISM